MSWIEIGPTDVYDCEQGPHDVHDEAAHECDAIVDAFLLRAL